MNYKKRIESFHKIAQNLATPTNTPQNIIAPASQDFKTYLNAKQYLFSSQDWTYVNKICNITQVALYFLSNGEFSFQKVTQTQPSLSGSRYGKDGGVLALVGLSKKLYQLISDKNNGKPYSSEQKTEIKNSLLKEVNDSNIPSDNSNSKLNSAVGGTVKTELTQAINAWQTIHDQ
jgi:hypothetical protein